MVLLRVYSSTLCSFCLVFLIALVPGEVRALLKFKIMACDTPFQRRIQQSDGSWETFDLPCGKCPPCKMRRVNSWVFRLQQEDKVATSAYFVTLTYDNLHIPLSENGYATLCKRDFQLFMKRLRKLSKNKLKYYAVGEYGGITKRPHYHMILFNLEDVKPLPIGGYRSELIEEAWTKENRLGQRTLIGKVDIGSVTQDSIAYTTKYIDKSNRDRKHGREDWEKEFSLMSKGLGLNYLTDQAISYHKADLSRNYLTKAGNHQIALPRYYAKRIYNLQEAIERREIIVQSIEETKRKDREDWERANPAGDYDAYERSCRSGRYNRFYSQQNRSKL